MMDLLAILLNIGKASVDLWLRMSPYLLFGFLFARCLSAAKGNLCVSRFPLKAGFFCLQELH
jgi:hypothetical protein